jgi:hypothetical protein
MPFGLQPSLVGEGGMRPFAEVDARRLEVGQAVVPLPARVARRGAAIEEQAVRRAVEASRL